MAAVAEASEKFATLGKVYELTDGMKAMLEAGETYY
jgi:3-hydroxyacyl-CoA dehydrogenase/enoyl-CoA hydratase/3-hydroxybutyryl-CoA epimerase/enoyl-CoA isomerase